MKYRTIVEEDVLSGRTLIAFTAAEVEDALEYLELGPSADGRARLRRLFLYARSGKSLREEDAA